MGIDERPAQEAATTVGFRFSQCLRNPGFVPGPGLSPAKAPRGMVGWAGEMQGDCSPTCALGGEGRARFSRRVTLLPGRKRCRDGGRPRLHRGRGAVGQGRAPSFCILHTGTLSGPKVRNDNLRPDVLEDSTAVVAAFAADCHGLPLGSIQALSCGVSAASPLKWHRESPSPSQEIQNIVEIWKGHLPLQVEMQPQGFMHVR